MSEEINHRAAGLKPEISKNIFPERTQLSNNEVQSVSAPRANSLWSMNLSREIPVIIGHGGSYLSSAELYASSVPVATPTPTPTPTPAPVPQITSISPSSPIAGGNTQNVTVFGFGFQPGLTVSVTFPGGGSTLSGSQIPNVTATSLQMLVTLSVVGTWTVRVNNPDGGQSNTLSFTVQNGASPTPTPTPTADFTVSASPASRTIHQGDSVPYRITVESLNGFNGPVTLAALNLPGNVVLAGTGFSPQILNVPSGFSAFSTFLYASNATVPTGTFPITIQCTAGGLIHNTTVSLTVNSFLELRLATEADNEYVVTQGGAAHADQKILSVMNQVEGFYEVELGLSIKVVYQSAWSTANSPYRERNPPALLGQLSDYWNSNRGSVARDVVHMWTGKNLDNATIGTAYLEALCRYAGNGRAAYGLSKGVTGPQQIAITAHEIGHNLGATHPNQQVPPAAECNNTAMSSSVSTNPQLTFCQFSRAEIARYLATSGVCLSAGTTGLSFAAHSSYAAGTSPRGVAVGDFNGDGKQDVAVANFESNNVSVLLGTDNGSHQVAVNYP